MSILLAKSTTVDKTTGVLNCHDLHHAMRARHYSYFVFASITVLFLSTIGCGPNGQIEVKNRVTGTVIFESQPVAHAMVTFHVATPEGVVPYVGQIEQDGNYSVVCGKIGSAQVTVDSAVFEGKEGFIELPRKFTAPKTSGLTYEVIEGEQAFDITIP